MARTLPSDQEELDFFEQLGGVLDILHSQAQ